MVYRSTFCMTLLLILTERVRLKTLYCVSGFLPVTFFSSVGQKRRAYNLSAREITMSYKLTPKNFAVFFTKIYIY
jgi:hypothetical protein